MNSPRKTCLPAQPSLDAILLVQMPAPRFSYILLMAVHRAMVKRPLPTPQRLNSVISRQRFKPCLIRPLSSQRKGTRQMEGRRIRTGRHASHAPSLTVQGSEQEMTGVVFARSALIDTVGMAVRSPLLSSGAYRFSPSVTHGLAAVICTSRRSSFTDTCIVWTFSFVAFLGMLHPPG